MARQLNQALSQNHPIGRNESSYRDVTAAVGVNFAIRKPQNSTCGKERLGRISKQGNRYLRWLLVAGAMAVIRYARQRGMLQEDAIWPSRQEAG